LLNSLHGGSETLLHFDAAESFIEENEKLRSKTVAALNEHGRLRYSLPVVGCQRKSVATWRRIEYFNGSLLRELQNRPLILKDPAALTLNLLPSRISVNTTLIFSLVPSMAALRG
jgi:hypothetical protein